MLWIIVDTYEASPISTEGKMDYCKEKPTLCWGLHKGGYREIQTPHLYHPQCQCHRLPARWATIFEWSTEEKQSLWIFFWTLSGVAGLRVNTLLWGILIGCVKSECKSSMYSVTGEKLAVVPQGQKCCPLFNTFLIIQHNPFIWNIIPLHVNRPNLVWMNESHNEADHGERAVPCLDCLVRGILFW